MLEDSYVDGWHGGSIEFNYINTEFGVLNSGTVTVLSTILDLFTASSCGQIECGTRTGDPYYATISADLYGEELSWEVLNS